MFIVPSGESPISNSWVVHRVVPLSKHIVAEAEAINLLHSSTAETPSSNTSSTDKTPSSSSKKESKPRKTLSYADEKSTPHLKPVLTLEVVTDLDVLDRNALPGEFVHAQLLATSPDNEYLPILLINDLTATHKNLRRVKAESKEMEIRVDYNPVTFGKVRFTLHMMEAIGQMASLGFRCVVMTNENVV